MVVFHSYVSLPEGKLGKLAIAVAENPMFTPWFLATIFHHFWLLKNTTFVGQSNDKKHENLKKKHVISNFCICILDSWKLNVIIHCGNAVL